jgi:uncharacterized membrane protein
VLQGSGRAAGAHITAFAREPRADARPFRSGCEQTHGGPARGRDQIRDACGRVTEAVRHARCSPDAMERNIRSRLIGVNIPAGERIATALGGAAAIAFGLRRGRSVGDVLAVAGAAAIIRAATGRCPAYRARSLRKGIQLRRAITVQATPREVYELWRDFANLPRFIKHLSQVTVDRGGISHWVAEVAGTQLAWRVKIIEDVAARRLRWRSLPGGDVCHEGTLDVREAPGGRGTVVELKLHWLPPGGVVVAAALHELLRRLASIEIGRDLARFQQLIETGEITTAARRFDELPDDGALAGHATRSMPPPAATAETSTWTTASPEPQDLRGLR